MTHRLVASESDLLEVTPGLKTHSRVALDCEAAGFHRYTDQLCLVQLSTPSDTYLFDPLAADPAGALRPILESPDIQVVMHGADFDLRLLRRDLGIKLRGLFDTQTAASLLGARSIGLASLLEEHFQVSMSKKHQRADWARRPLSDELLDYAASDTRHLISLCDILTADLRTAGRSGWAEEEFRALEDLEWTDEQTDPVTRFKGARYLTPRALLALRAAIEWRDMIAKARDRAPFRVVGDPVLLSIVTDRPPSVKALSDIKGMSPHLAGSHGPELLARLDSVQSVPESELPAYPRPNRNGPGRLTPEEDRLADRIRALRSEKAKDLGLDKGVLLSNAQIQAIIRSA
ncbi:MAG: ribonuclease D, partial [Gemmatimonadetes bacterium]|nr:ribonuclease D [Gemmatimonadota bacterium]